MDAKHEGSIATNYLEERLSDRTMVERRNLLFASAFGLAVHAYGGTKPNIPWLDLKSEGLGTELLQGGLALGSIYLLCMFCMYMWDDFRRWTLSKSLIERGQYLTLSINCTSPSTT